MFQIYGENAGWQLFGWLLVFVGLILVNELARRTKQGGIFCFLILPAGLTVYFIAVAVGASMGAEWALNNPTYLYMNSWFHYAKLYAATIGCIGFMMLKYKSVSYTHLDVYKRQVLRHNAPIPYSRQNRVHRVMTGGLKE